MKYPHKFCPISDCESVKGNVNDYLVKAHELTRDLRDLAHSATSALKSTCFFSRFNIYWVYT